MYVSSSLLASALVLSLSTSAQARVTQKKLDTENLAEVKVKKVGHHGLPMKNVLRKRQTLTCNPDFYTNILNDAAPEDVQVFCNRWLGLAPATVTSTSRPSTTIVATGRGNETRTTTEVITVIESSSVSVPSAKAAILPRAASFAARVQAVNQIINSVLTPATTTGPAEPVNTDRVEDENGLTHACECMVQWGKSDPTATVTTVSTAPARYTMVGTNSGALMTVTETVTSTVLESNGTGNGESTTFNPTITAPPSMSFISSGSIAPTTAFTEGPIVGPRVPVVIGIPFSCPSANSTSAHFIVGTTQYEYVIFCNKAIKSSDSIRKLDTIPDLENETACAEYCSLLNHAVNGTACGAAQFTRNSNGDGGSCTLDGTLPGVPTDNIFDQPGSVAIILKGSSNANGQDCEQPGITPSIVTAAPADLLSSIASTGHSLSIPGLLTRSETGGAVQTYYSTGSTDSSGFYHYSWYSLYKSSSSWWEVYAATWSSCSQVPVTITKQLPATVSSGIVITTIINGVTTTIISGNSTSIFSSGGGKVPPSGVPAATTSGGVVLSTGVSTFFWTSEGGASGQGPAATAQPAANGTAVTVTGATGTTISEGGNGVIPPSATSLPGSNSSVIIASGSSGFEVSSATSTSNSTSALGSSGSSAAPDAAEATISSGISTGTSAGGSGVVPPAPTNGTAGPTSSGGDSESPDDLSTDKTSTSAPSGSVPVSIAPNSTAFVVTSGTTEFTASGSAFVSSGGTFVSLSTGAAGSQGPIIATLNSTAQLPTAPVETPAATAGSTESGTTSISSGGTFVSLSTGGAGSQGPAIATLNSSALLPTAPVETTIATISGSTVSGSLIVSLSTGGAGSQGPVIVTLNSSALLPTAPVETTIATISGSTVSGSLIVSLSTGGAGSQGPAIATLNSSALLPTAPLETTVAAISGSTVSGSTIISLSTGGAGSQGPAIATLNSTALSPTAPSGTAPQAISSTSTKRSSSGGGYDYTPIPSPATETVGSTASVEVPIASVNSSAAAGTGVFPTAGLTSVILSTGSSGVLPPAPTNATEAVTTLTVNSTSAVTTTAVVVISSGVVTAPASASVSPILSSNGTQPLGPDSGEFSAFGSTGVILSTGSAGVVSPSEIETAPASVTPTVSSNATIPASTGGFSSTGTLVVTVPGNSTSPPLMSGTAPPVPVSSGASMAPSASSNVTIPSSTGDFSNTDNPRVPGNRTRTSSSPYAPGTAPPVFISSEASVTPSLSLNVTIPSSTGDFSNTDNPRVPGNRTRTSSSPYAPGTAPPVFISTEASITPSLSSNNTVLPTTGIFSNTEGPRLPGNNTSAPSGTAPAAVTTPASITPSPSSNATIPAPMGDFSNTDDYRTFTRRNSTAPVGTGTAPFPAISSTALPAFNTTAPMNTGTTPPVLNVTSLPGTSSVGTISSSRSKSYGGYGPLTSSATSTASDDFNNSSGDRSRRSRTRSSTATAGGSSAGPIASVNSTLVGTGTASLVVPTLSLNSSAPVGTASVPLTTVVSVSPMPVANTTVPPSTGGIFPTIVSVVTGTSGLPVVSSNSSAFLPTGTAPAFTLAPPGNITSSFETYSMVTGSSGLPTPPSNFSVPATLVTSPAAAGTSGFPTPSSNVTIPDDLFTSPAASGTSGFPTPLSNMTIPGTLITSPVAPASGSPTPYSNVTIPGTLVTAPAPAGTSGFPTPLSNVTIPGTLVTSPIAPASGSPTPYSNVTIPGTLITAPAPAGTSGFPTPLSNVTIPGTLITAPAPVGTSGFPTPLSNVTIPGTLITAPAPAGTSGFPTPLSNVTIPGTLVTAPAPAGTSGFPTPLSNVTIPGTLGTSPAASATPVVSSNGTTEACPTALETSIIPHTQIITTVSYETVVVGPSTCLPTASGYESFPTVNATFPGGTSPVVETTPSATVVIVVSPTPSPTSSSSIPNLALPGTANYRRSGDIATQEQIDSACDLTSNLVLNPNFAIGNMDNGALGWTISPSPSDDPTVRFNRNTTDDGTTASVQTARTAHSLTLSQPLTLCPNTRYKITSTDRAENVLSKCTTEYLIGDKSIYTATPGEVASSRDAYFTAGSTPAEVSQDLRVRSRCQGESGANVGADPAGWMGVEFGGLEIVPAPA